MPEKLIGKVVHYFDKIQVAVVKVDRNSLKVGDTVHFVHGERDFTQTVDSLQVDHTQIENITAGQEAGLKVIQPVRPGDKVYLVS